MKKTINHGVRLGRRPTDFVAGILLYEERNPSGDWTNYLTKEEQQFSTNPYTDTMACVSFSANHSIEIQHKFLTGIEVNYSNRWLAKMSNTTKDGNYLSIVADTIRNSGAVLEEVWPEPNSYTWETYYSQIPQDVINKGKEFLQAWSVSYEWIDVNDVEAIKKALKQAPLQVVIPGHAVVEILNMGDYFKYFDTYAPFEKQRKQNEIQDALKIVLTRKDMTNQIVTQNKNGELRLVLKASTPEQWAALTAVYGIDGTAAIQETVVDK